MTPSTSDLLSAETYHFSGITGSGMLPLAGFLAEQGACVSGSDRSIDTGAAPKNKLDFLNRRSIQLYPQDGSGVIPGCELIRSAAVEENVPDMIQARKLNIPVTDRGRFLGRIFSAMKGIGVAGSSGKTTTTAMIHHILAGSPFDPWAIVGGTVLGADRNEFGLACAKSDMLCCEVDESDRSIDAFSPFAGIVTNMGREHYEADELRKMFGSYLERTTDIRISGMDTTPDTFSVNGKTWKTESISATADGTSFSLKGTRITLSLLGRHNGVNAAMAAALCMELGLTPEWCAQRLASFRGVARRLQPVPTGQNITLIDDFGHNPEKILASLKTVRTIAGNRRILACFQPHGFSPLKFHFDAFAQTFTKILTPRDRLFVFPVFYSGGTVSREVTSQDLAERVEESGLSAQSLSREEFVEKAHECIEPGDILIIMGARDDSLPNTVKEIANKFI